MTIDLTLSNMTKCHIYSVSFRSDHWGIYSGWDLAGGTPHGETTTKDVRDDRLERVSTRITQYMGNPTSIKSENQLDEHVVTFIRLLTSMTVGVGSCWIAVLEVFGGTGNGHPQRDCLAE